MGKPLQQLAWAIALFYLVMGVCYPARLLEVEESYAKALEIIVS